MVVINIYEQAGRARSAGMNPGSHAGEFEIALYHYYSGRGVRDTRVPARAPVRRRPPNIYGLDLAPRSDEGVISDPPPDHARAIEKSREVGEMIDSAALEVLESNLDVFFSEWDMRGGAPENA